MEGLAVAPCTEDFIGAEEVEDAVLDQVIESRGGEVFEWVDFVAVEIEEAVVVAKIEV
jgi:hypothetical protein